MCACGCVGVGVTVAVVVCDTNFTCVFVFGKMTLNRPNMYRRLVSTWGPEEAPVHPCSPNCWRLCCVLYHMRE